jgi:hypothetical protein
VDDSIAFCPTCEASQIQATAKQYFNARIRVLSEASSVPVLADEARPHVHGAQGDGHAELRSALYAGVIGALLSLIQPRVGFALALPLAGFVSVLLYRRRVLDNGPSRRAGFRLGALTGLFGFGFLMVYGAAEMVAGHTNGGMHAAVIETVQQARARAPDPQTRHALEYFVTPSGVATFMILAFLLMCATFVLLSALGGAVSASLLSRKGPPEQ